MTLLFSAAVAGVSMAFNWPHPGRAPDAGGLLRLLIIDAAARELAWGLLAVFALTGFMGLTLGPVINNYLTAFQNGHQLVMLALGRDRGDLPGPRRLRHDDPQGLQLHGWLLMVGVSGGLLGSVAAVIFSIPALLLAVSVMFVILMSGMILYQVSELVARAARRTIACNRRALTSPSTNLFLSRCSFFGSSLATSTPPSLPQKPGASWRRGFFCAAPQTQTSRSVCPCRAAVRRDADCRRPPGSSPAATASVRRETRAVEGCEKLGLAGRRVTPARLPGGAPGSLEIGAGRDLPIGALARQPDLDVGSLAGRESHVRRCTA